MAYVWVWLTQDEAEETQEDKHDLVKTKITSAEKEGSDEDSKFDKIICHPHCNI